LGPGSFLVPFLDFLGGHSFGMLDVSARPFFAPVQEGNIGIYSL